MVRRAYLEILKAIPFLTWAFSVYHAIVSGVVTIRHYPIQDSNDVNDILRITENPSTLGSSKPHMSSRPRHLDQAQRLRSSIPNRY